MPVVMLTSSAEERDMIASYSLGVNSYIVKPVDFAKFVEEVAKAGCYWVLVNRLPSDRAGDGADSRADASAQDPAGRGQPRGHRVDGARVEARRARSSTGAAWIPTPDLIRECSEFAPSIVLSDFAMPHFDGLSALEDRPPDAARRSVHLRVGNDRRGNGDPVAAQRRERLHSQVQPFPAAHGGQAGAARMPSSRPSGWRPRRRCACATAPSRRA